MGPFRKIQSQLMKYVLQHPQLKKMVEQSAQFAARNPTVRNMQNTAQSTFESVKSKVNGHAWGPRIIAFLTANFIGILFLLPMIWGTLKHSYRTLTAAPESGNKTAKRKEVKEQDTPEDASRMMSQRVGHGAMAADDADAARAPAQRRRRQRRDEGTEETRTSSADREWATRTSIATFSDAPSALATRGDNQGMGSTQRMPSDSPFAQHTVDFGSSFLVKMGDATGFTSSLDHETMTGKVTYNK